MPQYVLRDRAYGATFKHRMKAMGIRDRPISPRSPWRNPYTERLIGPIRRHCLDHAIAFSERHLNHVLKSYKNYYNENRTRFSLDKDTPISHAVQSVARIVPLLVFDDLHHQYTRI